MISGVCELPVPGRRLAVRVPCSEFAANPTTLAESLWQPVRDLIFRELGIAVSVEQAGNAALAAAGTAVAGFIVTKLIEDAIHGGSFRLPNSLRIPKAKVDAAKSQAATPTSSSTPCPTGKDAVRLSPCN